MVSLGMKNTELKVGQSFDVVEVICDKEYEADTSLFKKNGHTLCNGSICLINGNSGLFEGKDQYLYLNKTRRKLIAKLTITKLK